MHVLPVRIRVRVQVRFLASGLSDRSSPPSLPPPSSLSIVPSPPPSAIISSIDRIGSPSNYPPLFPTCRSPGAGAGGGGDLEEGFRFRGRGTRAYIHCSLPIFLYLVRSISLLFCVSRRCLLPIPTVLGRLYLSCNNILWPQPTRLFEDKAISLLPLDLAV